MTNNGPDTAELVGINSFFPSAPFDSESASSTLSACSVRRDAATYRGDSASSVGCGRVTLAPGEIREITVTARAIAAGSYMVPGRAFETVRGDDPDSSNNSEEKTFTVVAAPRACDIGGDVDLDDVQAILAARGQPASGPDDPRDPDGDGDGVITVLDAPVRAAVRARQLR